MSDLQQTLLDKLKDRLALDCAEGVLPQFIIGSDEYGQHFFPQSSYTWAQTGAVEVLGTTFDDKRQFTGNVVHNADGEILFWHGIYAGKSERSLPSEAARASPGAEGFLYGVTANHWSNLAQKKKLIEHIVAWRKTRLQQLLSERKISFPSIANQQDFLANAPMVILLDCLPVNISTEIKEWLSTTYPFIRGRYIPAGLTGGFQINDPQAPQRSYTHGSREMVSTRAPPHP